MAGLLAELRTATRAALAMLLILGLVYGLGMTGLSQLLFPSSSDGSTIERDGVLVGSSLIGQRFTVPSPGGASGRVPDPAYFQGRPSATGYSADVTYFNNLGPNSRKLSRVMGELLSAYVLFEGRWTPGLTAGDVPVDATSTSGSGVDPHISPANAEIQANRIAAVRDIDPERLATLIDEHTEGRALGFLGEPGVNYVELNVALDTEAPVGGAGAR